MSSKNNFSTMKVLYIISLGAIFVTSQDNYFMKSYGSMLRKTQQCKRLDEACAEDCECCDYDKEPMIRCEKRNKPLGYRCYKSAGVGEVCANDKECRSQKCLNGRCVPHFAHRRNIPEICSLTDDYSSVRSIKGTYEGNECNCPQ